MFSNRRPARVKLQLGFVRFHRLLEEARRLLDLVVDGKEKSLGDYIFDRQYVISLLDRAVERVGKLVFDAHVLLPEGSDALFAAYDGCRDAARRRKERVDPPGRNGRELDWIRTPEYRFLMEVVGWMESAATAPYPLGVLDAAVDRAVRGFAPLVRAVPSDPLVRLAAGNGSGRVDLIDLDRPEGRGGEASADARFVRNRPLLRMLEEPGSAGESGGRAAAVARPRRWIAAVRDDRVGVIGSDDGPLVVVAARLTGQPSEDYLMCWSETVDPEHLALPSQPVPTLRNSDRTAWWYDLPTEDLEEALRGLGGALLGRPEQPVEYRRGRSGLEEGDPVPSPGS